MKFITQCASNKSITSENKTEMVNFNNISDVNERVDAWLNSLFNQTNKINSWDLYKGHYYQILNQSLQNINIEKCIISTGYGVLYEEDLVTDYMVTYASHIDEPTKINQLKGVNFREWHTTLCNKRNITPLDEWVDVDDTVVVLLGYDYLKVIEEDLLKIYNKLNNKNNFIVISVSKNKLLPNTLPIDGTWRKWLGGPQNVMGPNIFKKIIEDGLTFDFEILDNHFQNVYKPQAEKLNIKVSDEFFIKYIEDNPTLSEGQLIKRLRGSGISISTGRMKRLKNPTN